MATKETYLYFAENLGGDGAGDSLVVPASTFTGMDPVTNSQTRISFRALKGANVDDHILITHVAGKFKELCEVMATLMNSDKNGLVVVFDEDNLISHPLLNAFGIAATVDNITLS